MNDDIKAIRDALAAVTFYPSGTVSYTPEHWLSCCHPERIARLLDALEAAQKDAERLNWLDENPDCIRRSTGYLGSASSWTVRDADGVAHDFMSARAAIDAAMKGTP